MIPLLSTKILTVLAQRNVEEPIGRAGRARRTVASIVLVRREHVLGRSEAVALDARIRLHLLQEPVAGDECGFSTVLIRIENLRR